MVGFDSAVARLPVVLVVDPVANSRFTMWRLLSRSLGVLEAPDAERAHQWLSARPGIDALLVQEALPDADGRLFLESLARERVSAASRALLLVRPIDVLAVVTSLTTWFFAE